MHLCGSRDADFHAALGEAGPQQEGLAVMGTSGDLEDCRSC